MRLLCLGDIAIVSDEDWGHPWPHPAEWADDRDSRVLINWEFPVGETKNPERRVRGERYLACPGSPNALAKWGPGFASLATNHILDGGAAGLGETVERLGGLGFSTVGAGMTREQICRPLIWEADEGRLAILNWVFPETHPDRSAVPGPNCWPGPEEAARSIRSLKGLADWILVAAHWSDEDFSYPLPDDRVLAGRLAHIGADVVIGHHPHVVRGMEVVDSCPIFYSLGNFFFSDIPDGRGGWLVRQVPRNRESLGIEITFQRGKKPAWRALSFWRTKTRAVPDPRDRAARRMRRVSAPLGRFPAPAFADWYAKRRRDFDRWGYRYHFRVGQLGPKGILRFLARRLGIS